MLLERPGCNDEFDFEKRRRRCRRDASPGFRGERIAVRCRTATLGTADGYIGLVVARLALRAAEPPQGPPLFLVGDPRPGAPGIGANTIIFSVADSILLEPYPYKDPDRAGVIFVHDVNRPTENGRYVYTIPEFMDPRDQSDAFEAMTGSRTLDILNTNNEGTQGFDGNYVTYNRFEVFGARVILGRAFTEQDDQPSAPTVFVMSDKVWASQFNRDPSIVGSTMVLNGEPMTCLGIVDRRYLPNERDIVIAAHIPGSYFGRPGLHSGMGADGESKPVVPVLKWAVGQSPATYSRVSSMPRLQPLPPQSPARRFPN